MTAEGDEILLKKLLKVIFPLPWERTIARFDKLEADLKLHREKLDALQNEVRRMQDTQQSTQNTAKDTQNTAKDTLTISRNLQRVLQDARITEINTEKTLHSSTRDLIHLIEELSDDLQRLEGLWQSDAVARREGLEQFYPVKHIRRIRQYFRVMEPAGAKWGFCRLGRERDGGYIMLDDFEGRKIAYSFGISDDVSWDRDAAERGMDVYMYDHTIEGLPEENPGFHWQKIGLAGVYDETVPELKTLPMILEENGHQRESKMILKMDIEGAEWEFLAHAEEDLLGRFSQIAFEMHDLHRTELGDVMAEGLRRLNETHAPVHIHGNNTTRYIMHDGLVLPEVIESTWLNRREYDLKPSDKVFPTELDMANYERRPDIVLGCWRG